MVIMQLQHNTATQLSSLGWNEQLTQNFVPCSTLGVYTSLYQQRKQRLLPGRDGI
jgi:hypothetical protein